MSRQFAIRTENLTKEYGDVVAVDGLDLRVEPGTVYGFLGPNGAGKTTTLRLLTTLSRPSSGSATVDGHPIADTESVTSAIGYLPEEPPLYDELTGREQLQFFADIRDIDPEAASDRIESLLDRFDLDASDQRIATYSTGMRRKVGIANALLHDPPVVFLDEPTSGLDPRAAQQVRDTLVALSGRNTTVLLSTHALSVVEAVADTVGILQNGQLVAEGKPSSLTGTDGQTLEETFLEVTS